ncbi:methionine/alanine import family NSS transporter small subunit [Ornithinibacillus bavariensis]|nr:methionine/alanine import family NSS transporter small subunit [Ornithinibacillus bavariensis]
MSWIIFMILSIVIVWGGLVASIIHAVKKSKAAK